MIVTKSGEKLAHVIKKAIEDSEITMAEYQEIMLVANQDSRIDLHEEALLRELNALVANKTVTLKKNP